MIAFENIICFQGIKIKDSEDKYYISLFEDYGSISTYNDKLIGSGCETYDGNGDIFNLKEIDKIWYIMLNNKYMAYDHQENDITFIKDIPTKDQRLEFHQEDKKHKSIMTISKWKKQNEHVVIDWIKCSYACISVDDSYSPMRFQLIRYNCNNNINNKIQDGPINILFPRKKSYK